MVGIPVLEESTATTLKMQAVDSSATVVSTYKSTWCHNPEDHNMIKEGSRPKKQTFQNL
jgi:hypothetical protein